MTTDTTNVAVLIRDNIVQNVMLAEPDSYPTPEGCLVISVDPNEPPPIGSIYHPEDGTFTKIYPTPPVPHMVTPRQVRLLLLSQGLLDEVEAMIAQQDRAIQISWEFASEFYRNDPLLNTLAANLNLTEEQIDQFFIAAAQL